MTPEEQRKAFQRMKSWTVNKFWHEMNMMHNRAYWLGYKHAVEAMSCHPRVSKKMVEEIEEKAKEIREQWDGIREINLEETEGKIDGTQNE